MAMALCETLPALMSLADHHSLFYHSSKEMGGAFSTRPRVFCFWSGCALTLTDGLKMKHLFSKRPV